MSPVAGFMAARNRAVLATLLRVLRCHRLPPTVTPTSLLPKAGKGSYQTPQSADDNRQNGDLGDSPAEGFGE